MTQSISNDSVIFKPGEAEKILGITHDELTYFRRRGLVEPARKGKGRGSDNGYGYRQLFTLVLIGELRKIGIDTNIIKRMLHCGRKNLSELWDKILTIDPDDRHAIWIDIDWLSKSEFTFRSYVIPQLSAFKEFKISGLAKNRILVEIAVEIAAVLACAAMERGDKTVARNELQLLNKLEFRARQLLEKARSAKGEEAKLYLDEPKEKKRKK